MQWPFVIGSMLLHLLLWLIYGYIARPTKEQINALSRDIQDLHREQYRQIDQREFARGYERNLERGDETEGVSTESASAANAAATSHNPNADKSDLPRKLDIHSAVNQYVRGQQGQNLELDATHDTTAHAMSNDGADNLKDQVTAGKDNNHDSHKSNGSNGMARLSANRPFDSVSVQIVFHDEFNMLERLAPSQRLPYLALCTQLLNQAVTELLKQPLLLGVSAINEPHFDESGAYVMLKADNSHAKVALAGVMLAKLYLMLNKIIHDKHIELSRFALPAKAGVSDNAQVEAMSHLLESVGKKEQMLILLPNAGIKQINHHVQLQSVMRPTTVYERECAIFDGGNDAMIQRLADVRNAVLMIEETEAQG